MMKTNYITRFHKIGLVVAIMSLMGLDAFGQQDKKFAQAQQKNAAELRQYTWKSRTEVRKGSETKSVQLNQMRFDIDGILQQTQISATQQELPTRGLRGLIAKKKKEEFVNTVTSLGELAKSYSKLSPEKMKQFFENAVFTPEKNPAQNLLRIQAKDVLQPGDMMTIWVDIATQKQRKIEIQTTFDKNPVRIVSEFQDLTNGPTYMARSVIDYPNDELVITTDNFEYERNGTPVNGGKNE